MDWKKRAGAYLVRKKIRTGILFFIMMLITAAVLAVLSMQESTGKVQEKLLDLSNSGFQIESLLQDGNIEQKKMFQVEQVEGVKDAQYEMDGIGQLEDAKAVEREQAVQLDQGKMGELVSYHGVTSSNQELNFASGALNLKEGRALTKDESGKVLVHEELAKENNWTVGTKIKLKNFQNEGTTATGKEVTVEIVGIFNGKLSEQSTGLTSDLTENRIYMDYKTSQSLIGKDESNAIVHRAIFTVKDPSKLDEVISRVKELPLKWDSMQLSKNEQVFEQVASPIQNFKSLMTLLTSSVFVLAVIVLFLILLFTLRERIHEFGILMSVGISRKEIIAQILLELYTVAATSSIFALPIQVKSLFESSLPEFSLMQGLLTIGVVLIIIALAVLFSTAVILMKKPKKILSQMN